MTKIFLSYRRQDSAGVSGRIYDRLLARFGEGAIFMDVDSIPFGEDFRKHIDSAVGLCDVVLAVIGPRWAGEADGRRRLDDPRDYVRIEIESALKREIPVIPILIDHARMPSDADLPPSLAELAFRNAADVDSGRDFHPHVDRLIKWLEYHFQKATRDTVGPPLETTTSTASRSPGTRETDPPGMSSVTVEPEPSPTPTGSQDGLPTEVLTGPLFPAEEGAQDQLALVEPITAETVSLATVEQEPSPTPADPQDGSASEVLTEPLFSTEVLTEPLFSTEVLTEPLLSLEEETQDRIPLDDPTTARTVEYGPSPSWLWSVDRTGQAVRLAWAEPERPQEPMTDEIGTRPAPSTDAGSSMGPPDPDEAASGREDPQQRGIFGHLLRKFKRRTDGDHDDAERLFKSAVARIDKGHIRSGLNVINNLLKTNPSFIRAWEFCGEWYRRKEEYADALFHFEEALRLGTVNPSTYVKASYAASQTGDIERAYAILIQGRTRLSHDDLSGLLWYNLGCYATRLQKNEEAMCYLREAMSRGFNKLNTYMNDPDLVPLRQREDFASLLALANTDADG